LAKTDKNDRTIATNKKAYHEYFIEETYQAGISLSGTEVKSMRAGRCNLKESYIRIEGNSAFIEGMHISPYEHGNIFNLDPIRRRRLLLHKFEINKLRFAREKEGYTIIPVRVYFSRSYIKVDVALAKGKKLYDKREALAKKTIERNAQREFATKL